ncbi:exportin-2-like protein [Cinnamomum micranthum f. kanehirae]|uniref:Exportin-2-like protein n=1 Tax=Cinnamomum micranthum f. kanehirae TaxID=337451 RepID=A0A443PUC3_9MAGN|nr:exportin-2-like protein [Cinnamomum micranthum f. kanehirae]
MEWSTAPKTLSQCFLQTLSPDLEPRRRAESQLSGLAAHPGFGLAVLCLVSLPNVDDLIRIAAAINFKYHLRYHWTSSPDPQPYPPIFDAKKSEIKSHIVRLMVASSSSPRIQSQLGEALAIIGKHDFPKSWPAILLDLVAHLWAAQDYAPINGILSTANSIFKKFRYEWKTNDLLLDLKYCLDEFAAPLLKIFLKTASVIPANLNSADTLCPLIESQRLCCREFFTPSIFKNCLNFLRTT